MKTKRITSLLLSLILSLSILSACGASSNAVTFTVSGPDNNFSIHTPLQLEYFSGGDFKAAHDYATGEAELSLPLPANFEWSLEGLSTQPESYTVSLSKSSDMKDAKLYKTESSSLQVYNLEIDTDYFWTVTANCGEKSYTSAVKNFHVANDGPRNLYVMGVTNFRDIGGRTSELGGKVSQGLIFRCGTLNEGALDDSRDRIKPEGKKVMLEDLGVKTEIDLRKSYDYENTGTNKSPLGETVTYYAFPMDYNLPTWLDTFKVEIKDIFALLSDKSNYPVFIHCSIGTDRTGMMGFLINALLGVSEAELYFDYMFSNFGKIGGTRNIDAIWGYINHVAKYEGDTLSKRVENYLLDIGVTPEQIASFLEIMLEK